MAHIAPGSFRGSAFGALVRARRQAQGFSQSSLGRECGISQARVQQIEGGASRRLPEPGLLRRLAGALGISPGALLRAGGYSERLRGKGARHGRA